MQICGLQGFPTCGTPVQMRLDKALGTWVKSGQNSGFPERGWEGCNFLSSWEPADTMGKALEGSGLVFKQPGAETG